MNKVIGKINKFLFDSRARFAFFNSLGVYKWLSDEKFIKKAFYSNLGYELDLKTPKTFCEKLQWLKLYDRNPNYTSLVDKYRVREYVENKIGKEYLIPILGVWDNPEKINFEDLPLKFVLKCNHNSGLGMCVCTNKNSLQKDKVIDGLRQGLAQNYYYVCREWAYKNVKPKVIAEQFMEDDYLKNLNRKGLLDYKFYCFNGEPKFLYVGYANIKDNVKHDLFSFYNLDWSKADFYRTDHESLPFEVPKPKKLNDMIDIAKKLSEEIPFVRVDLYYINEKIYFSELTFYPGGGFGYFSPKEWEERIGSWIKLSEIEGLKR